MAGELLGAPFKLGIHRDGNSKAVECLSEEYKFTWYVSRKEIEICSPSRKDGIDLRKESELRTWYCSFLKDIGIKLGVPQVTIATAIMFCHRFYLHQSHAKNEWQTVATVCMFLASKVEDTPCPLDKVIVVAYETMYKKDPAAARRIHQKDVFAKQKERILIGETLLLSTIRFDCNVQHPYKPLLGALKKFGITQKDVTQAAWNFVNDSLRTTLCLQYKPHYIAAGSVFLAAKLYNVRLPSQRGYVWWNEFDVMPQLLNAAIHEMAEQLGYKGRTMVVARMVEKPTQNQLVAKQEMSSSPDSCLSSMPDLSKSSSSQDFQRSAVPVDSQVRDLDSERACASGGAELVCHQRDSENPRGFIVNFKTPGNAEHGRAMDVDKIKEMEKKRNTRVECVARDSTSGRDPACAAESQWQSRDSEIHRRSDKDSSAPGKGEGQVRAMDLDRIKEMAKKRKRERETVKRTDVTDDEAWIERELETGIEVAAGSGKKLRLSQGYEALIIVRRK